MDTTQRVKQVFRKWCDVPADQVRPELELSSLGIDSLTMLEVQLALRKEFGVAISDADLAEVTTFGDLVALVGEQ